jgi:hypothetical protein
VALTGPPALSAIWSLTGESGRRADSPFRQLLTRNGLSDPKTYFVGVSPVSSNRRTQRVTMDGLRAIVHSISGMQ